jgi:hypothetical protein
MYSVKQGCVWVLGPCPNRHGRRCNDRVLHDRIVQSRSTITKIKLITNESVH